jgi:hypothetical protein
MLYFKMMKKKTALKNLMEAYCASKSLQMDQMRFLFSGNKVRENQTLEELEMEDGDVIDAMTSHDQMRCLFSGNRVRENQTPEELEMEEFEELEME